MFCTSPTLWVSHFSLVLALSGGIFVLFLFFSFSRGICGKTGVDFRAKEEREARGSGGERKEES